MAKQLYLYNTPPRRKYRKGGRAGDDDDVVYSPNQLTTTRHRIPSRYPSDVLPNPGQNIRLTSGESGRMVGWAKDDNQPVMATPNGDYFAFTPQAWLPEVEVKGKRHLPTDGLDKMFVGMMAAPLAAYGLPAFANSAIGAAVMPYLEGAGTLLAGQHLASDNGVKRTYNLAKDGRYWEAFGSGVGDLLDLTGIGNGLFNSGKNLYNSRILTNIRDRNKFAYDYIVPYSYDAPVQRGKEYANAILKNPSYKPGEMPKGYLQKNEALDELDHQYRDVAFSKYLGLDEKIPLYIDNGDGTWSYNMNLGLNGRRAPKIEFYDYLTGNGGQVTNDFNVLEIGKTKEGYPVRLARMYDPWDLNPFRMTPNDVARHRQRLVRNAANKAYTSLYDKGIYKNKYGYRFLGGKRLNNLRYGYNAQPNSFDRWVSKHSNFEIGPILGGKPFVLDHKYSIYGIGREGDGGIKFVTGLPDEIMDITPEGEKWLNHFENLYNKKVTRLPKDYIYEEPFVKTDTNWDDWFETYKYGGKIHIKKKNQGKFTATMKRTGKSAEELSHSSNPLTRKRAIFALNARKWHH